MDDSGAAKQKGQEKNPEPKGTPLLSKFSLVWIKSWRVSNRRQWFLGEPNYFRYYVGPTQQKWCDYQEEHPGPKDIKEQGHKIGAILRMEPPFNAMLRCKNKIPNQRENIFNKSQLMVKKERSHPLNMSHPNFPIPSTSLLWWSEGYSQPKD